MIEKPTILITSLGRTGTQFFQAFFRSLLPQSTSLHEPDVINIFQYKGWQNRLKQVFIQSNESGFFNLLIRKPLGKWSLIALSDARFRNELEYTAAVRQIISQRHQFVINQKGHIYVEANIGYYGLIDVVSDVYANYKIAYVIRDGRSWIRSHMNWGQMYKKGKIRSLFAHTWPRASEIKGDLFEKQWKSLSRFERLCWAWTKLNKYALRTVQTNEDAKLFRFEDIFNSPDRFMHFNEMIQFLMANLEYEPLPPETLEGWLNNKIHKSQVSFPAWNDWTIEQKEFFDTTCGALMNEVGYVYG